MRQLGNHRSHFLPLIARLKPGVAAAQAQDELSLIALRDSLELRQSFASIPQDYFAGLKP